MTAATIYMALLGAEGLERVAAASHANTGLLVERLSEHNGVSRVFSGPFFHEAVLRLERPVAGVLQALANAGICGGYALEQDFPELGNALLVCATEARSREDIERYGQELGRILTGAQAA